MNDLQNETPQTPVIAEKSSKRAKVVLVVLLILFMGATCTLSYLWYQENGRANQLSNEVNSLKTPKTDAQSQDETQQQTTTFKAVVGKFSLTLPKDYVIIKNLDGGAEGASGITVLKIGTPNASFAGVVDDPEYKNIMLTATRASDYEQSDKTFENWRTRIIDDTSAQKLEPITIDGVNGDTYRALHLGAVLMAFFQKDGLWYNVQLQTEDVNSARKTLETILKDFKFTS